MPGSRANAWRGIAWQSIDRSGPGGRLVNERDDLRHGFDRGLGQDAVAEVEDMAGSAGGLASVAGAFSKLGLKPELVAKAVPVLVGFVTKSGGANLGSLLGGVLK